MLNCPECGRTLMDKTSDGGMRLRTRILLFDDAGTLAVCPSCKTRVNVPVKINKNDRKLKHVIV